MKNEIKSAIFDVFIKPLPEIIGVYWATAVVTFGLIIGIAKIESIKEKRSK